MDQASSAFSTGVPVSAAIPQLAGNSRQGFGLVDGTMRRASGWVISSNTLGLSTSLYDGDAGSRSTGKERDTESGNDYFEARYYSSAMGRFMSPDWSAKEEPVPYAKLGDPQTLNLYSYVENGPLNRVDADGHADQVVPNSAMTPLAECYDQGSSSGCPGGQAAGQVSSGIDHDTSDANNRAHADQAAANAGNGAAQPAQAQQKKPGAPDHLEKVDEVKFPNEEAVETYQVQDQNNRPTGVGDTITEHVTVTEAAGDVSPVPHTSHDTPINKGSIVIDIIGPDTPNHQGSPGSYSSMKTLQTFTVSDGKHTYVLTTKIQQFIQVQDGKVTQAGFTILVP